MHPSSGLAGPRVGDAPARVWPPPPPGDPDPLKPDPRHLQTQQQHVEVARARRRGRELSATAPTPALALALHRQAQHRLARGMDAQLDAVRHPQAEDVHGLARAGADSGAWFMRTVTASMRGLFTCSMPVPR